MVALVINETIVTPIETKLEERIDVLVFGGTFWEDNKEMGICVTFKVKDN